MKIHKIGNCIQSISSVIAAFMLLVLSLSVLFQIIAREIFAIPATWLEEIIKLSFFWMAMLGASILVRKQRHFSVNIINEIFKNKKVDKFLAILGHTVILFVAGSLFFYGLKFAKLGLAKKTPVLMIKLIWNYASIPTSAVLMIFYSIEMLLSDFGIIPVMTAEEMDKVNLKNILAKKGGK